MKNNIWEKFLDKNKYKKLFEREFKYELHNEIKKDLLNVNKVIGKEKASRLLLKALKISSEFGEQTKTKIYGIFCELLFKEILKINNITIEIDNLGSYKDRKMGIDLYINKIPVQVKSVFFENNKSCIILDTRKKINLGEFDYYCLLFLTREKSLMFKNLGYISRNNSLLLPEEDLMGTMKEKHIVFYIDERFEQYKHFLEKLYD